MAKRPPAGRIRAMKPLRTAHRLLLPLLSLSLLASAAGCAPRAAAERAPRLDGLPETRAREIACELTDRVGPRLAGSRGDAAARAWALARMRALGLANVREEPAKVTHWERGPISVELVGSRPASGDGAEPWVLASQPLHAVALGGSVSTPPEGITAEVIRVESIEALAEVPDEQVRGKIVFFDKVMPRERDGFESYGRTVDVRSRGAIAAAKKGAVASLIRSIATSSARFPHTGGMRYADDVPKIPAAALAVPDAELLARVAEHETPVVKIVLAATQHPDADSANVIGEITGREKPDEIVLLGAHLDSWDVGPGAVDDAAGVGVVLEVARLLKQDPPRRTVRVVLYANEENGLKGAFAYAAAHAEEMPKHQAAIEIDGGAGLAWQLLWRAGEGADALLRPLGPRLAPLGVERVGPHEHAGGADLIPLTPHGVPKLGFKQDARRYFDLHHSADDTCDKIVPEEIAQVTAATALVVRELAEMPARIPFAPPPPRAE